LFEGGETMIECFEDRFDNSFSGVGELGLVLLIKNNVNLEQREFGLGSTKCLNLVSSIVDVVNFAGVNY
jgi:hypothetical protein